MPLKQSKKLFSSFFKIGMIAFGGGYAIIPLLMREAVENQKWLTEEELYEIMAISQTLPGIIFVNSATMVGYRIGGLSGALIATIAAVTPTLALTLLITVFFWKYMSLPLINNAFKGILLGVTALILYSIAKTWRSSIKNYIDACIAMTAAVLLTVFKVNAVLVILGAVLINFLYQFLFKRCVQYKKSGEN